MPMMAITTSSSMRVKPARRCRADVMDVLRKRGKPNNEDLSIRAHGSNVAAKRLGPVPLRGIMSLMSSVGYAYAYRSQVVGHRKTGSFLAAAALRFWQRQRTSDRPIWDGGWANLG